jgi:hypothetical protein
MRTFCVVRGPDRGPLESIRVRGIEEADLQAAFNECDEWTGQGYEAAVLFGEDLRDLIRSFPDWFEEAL